MRRLMQRSPRAAAVFFNSRGDVITSDFLNTRFIHRALLPTRGPSTKQAVAMVTAASGHVCPTVVIYRRKLKLCACVCFHGHVNLCDGLR